MTKVKILTQEEIIERLSSLSGWEYASDKIRKQYEFADYLESITFLNSLTPFFEIHNHHPDVHIFYSKIVFELQRFDVGGKVTDIDFVVATEIEKKYAEKTL